VQVYHGDFLKDYHILGEGSVDCIITDPPYVKDWLENYEGFARAAEYVLKPGGFLITYVGHIHLDRILDQMCRHLDFYWIAALKHAGTTKAVHSRSVMCGFKPILIFHKPPRMAPKRYFCDVILGTGREKSAHEWQQGKEELRQIFEPFTDPGDTVLDPFMGSGTVLDMAREMGREGDRVRYRRGERADCQGGGLQVSRKDWRALNAGYSHDPEFVVAAKLNALFIHDGIRAERPVGRDRAKFSPQDVIVHTYDRRSLTFGKEICKIDVERKPNDVFEEYPSPPRRWHSWSFLARKVDKASNRDQDVYILVDREISDRVFWITYGAIRRTLLVNYRGG